MRKQILCSALAASLALGSVSAQAAGCYTDAEWKAAHVRVLLSDLTEAGLECANVAGHDHSQSFASFVNQYGDRLKANAKVLKAHFQRVYGGGAERELDKFVTKLANDASERGMKDMAYCAHSDALFKTALAIDKMQFEQAALDYVSDHQSIGEQCPAKPIQTTKAVVTVKASVAAKSTQTAKAVIPAKTPATAANATATIAIPSAAPPK